MDRNDEQERRPKRRTRKASQTTALPEEERVFLGFISHLTNAGTNVVDMCLTEKTGSGRTGPYNVQLTVVNNNCNES